MQSPKNLRKFRALASQPDGIGIKATIFVSPALVEDSRFNVHAYIEQQAIRAAQAWNIYDCDDCTYVPIPRSRYEERQWQNGGTVLVISRIVQVNLVKTFMDEGSANRGVDTSQNDP